MKTGGSYRVPAVVVGGGLNGLGVLRALARAGVPVVVLEDDKLQPAMHSRLGRKVLHESGGAITAIETLVKLEEAHRRDRPVLFLTREEDVSAVSAYRHKLEPLYRFTLPEPAVLSRMQHKGGFRELAEGQGALVPQTLCLTDGAQVESMAALQPPLVVKPARRDAAYSAAFRKAYVLDSLDEARHLVERILPVLPDVIVQEWVEGDDSDLYFCLQYMQRRGPPAASFTGRKIRSWPARTGGTASCLPAPDAAGLTDTTTAFFRSTGVVGVAGMEYKRDRRSGTFYMIEPTVGRTDYQEEVASLNGVNIPLAAYCSELGLPLPRARESRPPRIWCDGVSDRRSAQAAGEGYAKPAGGRIVDALWRAGDPAPGFAALSDRVRRRTRHTLHERRLIRKPNGAKS